jgi:hypothetical protein
MAELVNDALAMLVNVLFAPLIVLFVSVCVPVSVATTVVSMSIVPAVVIGPPNKPTPVATEVTPVEPVLSTLQAPFV